MGYFVADFSALKSCELILVGWLVFREKDVLVVTTAYPTDHFWGVRAGNRGMSGVLDPEG